MKIKCKMKTYSTADMTCTGWQQSFFVWQQTQSEVCIYKRSDWKKYCILLC